MNEETNRRAAQVYDVALWCTWPSLFPDYVGLVEAYGTYSAKVVFMEAVGIEKAARVAARRVGYPCIDRWSKVYIPLASERRGRGKWSVECSSMASYYREGGRAHEDR